VDIRLIDVEFVLPEEYLIPDALVKAQKKDDRYDVTQYTKRGEHYYASTRINHYWLRVIQDWADAHAPGLHARRGASAFWRSRQQSDDPLDQEQQPAGSSTSGRMSTSGSQGERQRPAAAAAAAE
jgi:hypothetical protein